MKDNVEESFSEVEEDNIIEIEDDDDKQNVADQIDQFNSVNFDAPQTPPQIQEIPTYNNVKPLDKS